MGLRLDIGDVEPPDEPPPCPPDEPDCLFWRPGILQDVFIDELQGWKLCFKDTYAGSPISPAEVLANCPGEALLLACGPTGAEEIVTLAAMGPWRDVTFPCGSDQTCSHEANGVAWYFDENWSWGFAPPGLPLDRIECDIEEWEGELRMCWHTVDGTMMWGYRCGQEYPGSDYARYVFTAG